eukprot:Amastigsp_a3339_12.p4 type:complete len:154 gc:universal Amastigsp_a3339_12:357-818(+)
MVNEVVNSSANFSSVTTSSFFGALDALRRIFLSVRLLNDAWSVCDESAAIICLALSSSPALFASLLCLVRCCACSSLIIWQSTSVNDMPIENRPPTKMRTVAVNLDAVFMTCGGCVTTTNDARTRVSSWRWTASKSWSRVGVSCSSPQRSCSR